MIRILCYIIHSNDEFDLMPLTKIDYIMSLHIIISIYVCVYNDIILLFWTQNVLLLFFVLLRFSPDSHLQAGNICGDCLNNQFPFLTSNFLVSNSIQPLAQWLTYSSFKSEVQKRSIIYGLSRVVVECVFLLQHAYHLL